MVDSIDPPLDTDRSSSRSVKLMIDGSKRGLTLLSCYYDLHLLVDLFQGGSILSSPVSGWTAVWTLRITGERAGLRRRSRILEKFWILEKIRSHFALAGVG
jgi:hypothetical protein